MNLPLLPTKAACSLSTAFTTFPKYPFLILVDSIKKAAIGAKAHAMMHPKQKQKYSAIASSGLSKNLVVRSEFMLAFIYHISPRASTDFFFYPAHARYEFFVFEQLEYHPDTCQYSGDHANSCRYPAHESTDD